MNKSGFLEDVYAQDQGINNKMIVSQSYESSIDVEEGQDQMSKKIYNNIMTSSIYKERNQNQNIQRNDP